MRKSVSLSLDTAIIQAIENRSRKHHLPVSRIVEEALRKAWRI